MIDSEYRGDVGVILINFGDQPFVVQQGDRIAQMIIESCQCVDFDVVDSLPETGRGD